MNKTKYFLKLSKFFIRREFSSKLSVRCDPEVIEKIENEDIKIRNHPGKIKAVNVSLPKYVVEAITIAAGDHPISSLIEGGSKITTYFKARHLPPEDNQINKKMKEIQEELNIKKGRPDFSTMSEEEITNFKQKREKQIKVILKQRIFSWKPIKYDQFNCLCYAIGRGAQEHAILVKIFKEIYLRDPFYKPRSYFDFGSGVGTGMWAINSTPWKNTIFEYFNVDTSRDMNELSDLILRGGNINGTPFLKHVFYRQHLPFNETKYDLVVSSFSLFELPNKKTRIETILNLWRKCDGYMIIVEEGTRCGFTLINEARNLILSLKDEEESGDIVAPCPHSFNCPRFKNPEDNTPCNFEIRYEQIPIKNKSEYRKALFSYVVFRKNKKSQTQMENENWPRIVRPVLKKHRHVICRTCTSDGCLQEIIFTPAKHGKIPYRCARSSNWGDRLPIEIEKIKE